MGTPVNTPKAKARADFFSDVISSVIIFENSPQRTSSGGGAKLQLHLGRQPRVKNLLSVPKLMSSYLPVNETTLQDFN